MSYDTDIVRAMWYEVVAEGMDGLILSPPNTTLVNELWKDNSSVLVSTIINDVPSFEVPLTGGGSLVRATLNAEGNYELLDEPASYPIALIYIYEVAHKDFDQTLALFGRVYQDDIGRFDFYKTNSPTFTIGPEYTEPYKDNHAAPKQYVDDNRGYTNLTSFVDQTAWRVFYSNTDGDVTELALGADGTYFKSNGPAIAPTFTTPSGAGDVVGPATNTDAYIPQWDGADSKALKNGFNIATGVADNDKLTTKGYVDDNGGGGGGIAFATAAVLGTL